MLKLAGLAFAPAALLSGLLFTIGWGRSERKRLTCCGGRCETSWDALGLALGFWWGYLVLNQIWFPNPARSVVHWLPHALVAILVIHCAGTQPIRRLLLGVVSFVLFGLLFARILGAYPDWSAPQRILHGAGLILLVLLLLFSRCSGNGNAEPPAWDWFLVFGLICAACLPCFFLAGSSKWAQVLGVAGLICAVGFLLSVFRRDPVRLSAATSSLLPTIFWFLIAYVHYFTYDLPLGAAILLIVPGMLILRILQRSEPGQARRRRRLVLYPALMLGLGLALFLTRQADPPPSPYA